MKRVINRVIILLSIIGVVTSCKKDDMNFKDAQVTAVKSLYEPTDGKTIYLQNSQNETVYFEWEKAKSEDGGTPAYEIVFDKENGNFSQPIYRITSANNGSASYLAVSHRTLNKIAYLSGFAVGDVAKFKWAVVSSRGINEVLSSQNKVLQVVRYEGFVETPQALFLKGEGSEIGDNASQALKFTQKGDGVFEIYTQLKANQPFNFIDAKTGTFNSYYFDATGLKEGTQEMSQVTSDAVYRLLVDFNTGVCTIDIVDRLYLFYNIDGQHYNFNYEGKGVWTLTSKIRIKYVDWGRSGELRHKFKIALRKPGSLTITTESWGHNERNKEGDVVATTESSYFNLYPSGNEDWDFSYRFSKSQLGMPNGDGPINTWWESPAAVTVKVNMTTANSSNYNHVWIY